MGNATEEIGKDIHVGLSAYSAIATNNDLSGQIVQKKASSNFKKYAAAAVGTLAIATGVYAAGHKAFSPEAEQSSLLRKAGLTAAGIAGVGAAGYGLYKHL